MFLTIIILAILIILATYPKFPDYTYETDNFILISPDGMGMTEKVQVWKNRAGPWGDLESTLGNEPLYLSGQGVEFPSYLNDLEWSPIKLQPILWFKAE